MEWTLPKTDTRAWQARASGGRYRLSISHPAGAPPAEGFPVLFLLDAKSCFGTCVEALRRMSRRPDATGVGDAVIVGIAPDGDALYDTASRERDFTNTVEATGPHDGAKNFLVSLEEELLPAIRAEFPLDPHRTALFGHSLAGYFVLWALATGTKTFSHYAAISPSIWWDRSGLTQSLLRADLAGRTLYMCLGQWEEALPPWQRGAANAEAITQRRRQRRMVANAAELALALQSRLAGNRLSFEVLQDEDHASIVSAAMPRTLRMLFGH